MTDEKLKIHQKEPKNQQTIHLKKFLDNLSDSLGLAGSLRPREDVEALHHDFRYAALYGIVVLPGAGTEFPFEV